MSRKLTRFIKKTTGRGSGGKVSVRHRGGEHKRRFREIDFKRGKKDIEGEVAAIEYDPNRSADIALLLYPDGERGYILAPHGLKVGDHVLASQKADIKVGNSLPVSGIPVGMPIHNLELTPGKGAQLVRGAGSSAAIISKENSWATVRLPSGEMRVIPSSCWATIGQVGRIDQGTRKFRKAGDTRHRGIRPTVRGVAQNPHSHPHGGGEGKSGIGMPSPKSPWGKKTLGKKTRKEKKYSDKYILKRREK